MPSQIKSTKSLNRKSPAPFLGNLLVKIAPQIGAKVLLEPKWGLVCQVTFKSGKRCYFRYNTLDLNFMGASEIARDKDYSYFFMDHMGYPTIPSKPFYSDRWARIVRSDQTLRKAVIYAKKLGYPVIVKPNSGSQGVGVSLVHSEVELTKALQAIWKKDNIAQVQKYIVGNDYRVVVLDDKVISAYQRVPLSVVGDGASSILDLLNQKQKEFVRSGRDTVLDLKDVRIKNKLKHHMLGFKSVIKKGERVYLLDNANLSTGGDSVDVTHSIHKDFKKIAVSLTRDMGLRLCGVDLMIEGSITDKPENYYIIEVNSAPGLDHYVKSGKAQEKIVEDMYLEVLKSLEK
jgi:D-alanine-D-alanine ligase-like ATP-grasp enzyme